MCINTADASILTRGNTHKKKTRISTYSFKNIKMALKQKSGQPFAQVKKQTQSKTNKVRNVTRLQKLFCASLTWKMSTHMFPKSSTVSYGSYGIWKIILHGNGPRQCRWIKCMCVAVNAGNTKLIMKSSRHAHWCYLMVTAYYYEHIYEISKQRRAMDRRLPRGTSELSTFIFVTLEWRSKVPSSNIVVR